MKYAHFTMMPLLLSASVLTVLTNGIFQLIQSYKSLQYDEITSKEF